MLNCPDRQVLTAFAVGNSPLAEIDEIAAHLSTCMNCQQTLEMLEVPADPVLMAVQSREPESPFFNEPECRAALAAIAELCPVSVYRAEPAVTLGTIREYQLLEQIGAGGMGAVYRALHTHLNRVVALKVLPAERLSDPQAVARFRQEMRAVGQLDHPHIVRAFDAGQHENTNYLVLEYVDGVDLSDLSHRCGHLSIPDACELIRQAALGLDYAHRRHLVHRDIKPSNLVLTTDGQVKILDFGLALLRGDQLAQAELTTTGQVMGTLDYMAPEQIQDTHSVDIRADLYSLGCTLFKLLTGEPPFAGPQYRTLYQKMQGHTQAAPPAIAELRPDVPPALAAVFARLLAKSPVERFATPAELVAAITPFAAGANLPRLIALSQDGGDKTQLVTSSSAPSVPVSSHLVDTNIGVGVPHPAAAAADPKSESTVPRSPRRTSRWLFAVAAVILLGAVITITTSKGTVTIAQPDAVGDEVEIVVRSGGEDVAILDKSNHWTVNIRNGEYTVAVRGGSDQFQVKDGKLSVKRFGKTLVEVEAKPAAIATDADRRAAEWVLSIGGNVSFKEGDQQGSTEVVGDLPRGPFDLTSVDLHNNLKVSDAGLEHLKDCKSLSLLYLNGTKISDAGLARIKGCKNLSSLFLSGPQVTDAGLAYFKECQNFIRLYLHHTRVSDVGLAQFKDCRNLEYLYLAIPEVSDAGLAHFKHCKNLTFLSLGDTPVTDAGIAHFRDCPNLTNLYLDHTRVSDAGLLPFKDCKSLEVLDLSSTQVSDVGLEHFIGCAKLGYVKVKNTKATETGVKKLSAALPQCKIEWDGGVIEAKPSSDPDRRAAEWVLAKGGMVRCRLDGTVQKHIKQKDELPEQPFVVINVYLENTAITDADLARLVPLSDLRYLKLDGTSITDAGLQHVAQLRSLEWLELRQTATTDAGLTHLADLGNLTTLYLENTRVTDAGMVHLARLKNLRVVRLSGAAITDAALVPLKTLESLEGLYLYETKVSDAGMRDIVQMKLTELRLWGTIVGDAGLIPLKDAMTLTHLTLVASPVTDAGMAHLREIKSLNYVQLSDLQLSDAGLAHLHGLKHLVQLSLERPTKVTREGVERFHAATPQCRILSEFGTFGPTESDPDRRAAEWVLSIGGKVELASVKFDRDELKLADLKDLPTEPFYLVTVDLNRNSKVTPDGLAKLKELPYLNHVYLNQTTVGDDGIERLAGPRTFHNLELADAGITDAGLQHLQKISITSTLVLSGNAISDTGLERLAKGKTLAKVQYLYLAETQISDAGLASFSMLGQLKQLRLAQTKVTEAGVRKLAASLPACRIEWDGGVIEPDAERALALWVLRDRRNGEPSGTVQIQFTDGRLGSISVAGEIPAADFRVIGVYLTLTPTDADFVLLASHAGLESIEIRDPANTVYVAGLRHIAKISGLRLLHVRYAKLHDADLDVLAPLASLRSLDLTGCGLTDGAVSRLERLNTLTELKLGYNAITDAGLKQIVRLPALETLELFYCPVTRRGLSDLAQSASLKNLWLGGVEVGNDGMQEIGKLRQLERLDCTSGRLQPGALAPIKQLQHLRALRLAANAIGDPDVAQLSELKRLEILRLDETQITDGSLKTIAGLSGIKELSLVGTRITDAGVSELSKCRSLRELYVTKTGLSQAAIDRLRNELPQCRIVSDFGEYQPKSPSSDPDRRAAEWVLSLGGYAAIKENGRERQTKSIGDLPAGPFELIAIELLGKSKVDDAGLAVCKDCRSIRSLELSNTRVTDAGLAHFKNCENLVNIQLYDCPISDAGLAHFQHCKNLSRLRLDGTGVTDAGVAYFKDCQQLTVLHLDRTRVSDAGLANFQNCRNLKELNLGSSTTVSDAGLTHFRDCKNLTALDLRNANFTDVGLVHFQNCQQLETLRLAQTKVSDAGLAYFRDSQKLLELVLDDCGVSDAGLDNFAGCSLLNNVYVKRTKVTEAGVKKLAAELPRCRIDWDGGTIEPKP